MTSDVSTTAPEVAAASIGVMSDMDAAATRGPKVRGASWSNFFFFFSAFLVMFGSFYRFASCWLTCQLAECCVCSFHSSKKLGSSARLSRRRAAHDVATHAPVLLFILLTLFISFLRAINSTIRRTQTRWTSSFSVKRR